MTVDKNVFFREVTLRICSSLDLHLVLAGLLVYLQDVFPLREIVLSVMDKRHKASRVVANASADKQEAGRRITPLSDSFWEWLEKSNMLARPIIITDAYMKTLHPDLLERFPHRKRHKSEIAVPLVLDETSIGIMYLFAPDNVDYTQDHLELISLVAHPFALGLSNALAYQQMIRRHDLLVDDKEFLQNELARPEQVIGEYDGLAQVMEMVNNVAPMNNTVMLNGETGVGKEIIANAIHQRSKRRNGPFIKVNCGAIPEQLIDSEMFGYEKGAFTGATVQKRGRFERADGGTIFLDEVGELSLAAQVRLLRVLANREIERVGGVDVVPVNIRVITATHRDLKQMVDEGKFREDLWFRLNVFPIIIPPLRHRKEDIPALSEYFVSIKSREFGISPPTISPLGLGRLSAYDWPGNVRELENVIEREMISIPNRNLDFASLNMLMSGQSDGLGNLPPTHLGSAGFLPMDEAVTRYLQAVLKSTKGKVSGPNSAAEVLNMNPGTLRSQMRRYKINRHGEKI